MSFFFNRRPAISFRCRPRRQSVSVAALESLEDRVLLSSIALSGGTLSVAGSNANDVLRTDYALNGERVLARISTGGRLVRSAVFMTSRVSAIIMSGGGGNDRLLNQTRVLNKLIGGAGNDYLTGGVRAGSLYGQGGNDRLVGRGGDDWLNGGSGDDHLIGGNDFGDYLFGAAGDDVLQGENGDDSLDGGDGYDKVVEVVGSTNLALTQTTLTGRGTDSLTSIERAMLIGGERDNVFSAGNFQGPAIFLGGGGNDFLIGGSGGDLFANGGAGNDKLYGGVGNDSLNGGPGNDLLVYGEGDDVLNGGAGNDWLHAGGSTTQTLSDTTFIAVGAGGCSLRNIENALLIGTSGSDAIYASGFNGRVRIDGRDGNDYLVGGYGDDVIYGGEGDDTLYGYPGGDMLLGGNGTDMLGGGNTPGILDPGDYLIQ